MGALAPISPWMPEDDLLLKNAVEAGASLESLAKGAVEFSRRFTIREVQERWYSLLYDPVVSAEASARMLELERSTFGLPSKSNRAESSKENKEGHKRKVESVRRYYYAMRKRICNDPLNQGDLSFLVSPMAGHFERNDILGDPMTGPLDVGDADLDALHCEFDNGNRGQLENVPIERGIVCEDLPQIGERNMSSDINSVKEMPVQNTFEDTNLLTDGNNNNNNMYTSLERDHVFNSPVSECEASLHHLQYSPPPPAMPVWRNMDSLSAMDMAGDSQLRGKSPETGDANTNFQSNISCDEIRGSTTCAQYDLVALSDTLLNLSDDEMLLMDDEGKEEIDKYGLGNLLLDSPSDVNEDQMLKIEVDASVPPETDKNVPDSLASVSEEPKPSSASDTKARLPDFCGAGICCTLNTEDLEVPFNDHVIFSRKSRLPSFNRRNISEVSHSALSTKDNQPKQANETGLSLVDKEMKRFGELHSDSQSGGQRLGFNRLGELNAKLELPRSESFVTKSRHPGTTSAVCSTLASKEMASGTLSRKQSCPSLLDASVKHLDGLKNNFEIGLFEKNQEGQVAPANERVDMQTQREMNDEMVPKPLGELSLSDLDDQSSDMDADIPCFSDIESMILDMDLGPEDVDSYSSQQVAMYQSEEAKRRIIRLEQAAHARMQRAMASHGAIAVLYGRHSKHYIKKPTVLLGRATEDVTVDIDLGKEGRANKISRRQAIIKMDDNGVFRLRNLGRHPIYVDSSEVHPGQSLDLHSNCLIEIQEMPFIFETKTDATRLKHHLR